MIDGGRQKTFEVIDIDFFPHIFTSPVRLHPITPLHISQSFEKFHANGIFGDAMRLSFPLRFYAFRLTWDRKCGYVREISN